MVKANHDPRQLRPAWVSCAASAMGLALLAIGVAWVKRTDIAQNLIDRQLRQLRLSARYAIDEIGTNREVFGEISIGDPANPDLSIERLEISVGWQGGLPAVTQVKVVGARLFGKVSNGHLGFGSLDPVLFGPSQKPFRLPDIDLSVRGSQAIIGGNQGLIGVVVDGDGNLRDGFTGTVAMAAPVLQGRGWVGHGANFHGRIAVDREQPRIFGDLSLAQLASPGSDIAVQAPALHIDMRVDSALDAGTVRLGLTAGAAKVDRQGASKLTGATVATLRDRTLAGDFMLNGDTVHGQSVLASRLGINGHFRAELGAGARVAPRFESEGTLSGRGLALDANALAALARAQGASAGTFAEPLLARLRAAIARETTASRFSGNWMLRRSADETSLVFPEMHIDGAQTPRWLSVSRMLLKQAKNGAPAISGNFAVAGQGFPQVRGRIMPLVNGGGQATLAVPVWHAGASRFAVPDLAVHWDRSGQVNFSGRTVSSGALPGGLVQDLTAPLDGSWSTTGGLLLGSRCAAMGFARLAVGQLEFRPAGGEMHSLRLCPGGGAKAMVVLDRDGPRVSVRSGGLDLAGQMNGSAVKIASGDAMLAWPGGLSVKSVDVVMQDKEPGHHPGPGAGKPVAVDPALHMHLAQFSTTLGAEITGHFTGGDVTDSAIPAALRAASGDLRWAGGRLTVDRASFRIEDPATPGAFVPIEGNEATASMAEGKITGAATLRTTIANRELAHLIVMHDLASGRGHADVTMPGLTFDKTLQPKQLSAMAQGIIADAKGTLEAKGRFDWDNGAVSSSGWISTTGFDFAAAFGPVRGVAGKIEFTDLLGMVTAPDQRLSVAMINPGIEVDDGVLTFALKPGRVLVVKGAQWPFLDGKISLLPTQMVLGANEARRFELRVDGLNAAKFLARMDLSNLAATGTFDGNLPIVFDSSGGRIEKGALFSRPPGGTVSYVGALTYKDLSPMANFAFQALRAMKYREMRIAMDGSLAGEVVTHVNMEGLGQATGARRNFITNQIARLPIRFNVTITAPFVQLITSFRELYDPALVADPRALGLIDAKGRPIPQTASGSFPPAKPLQPAVQP